MGYETIGGGMSDGNWAPTKYVRYTTPEDRDPTEKELILKKDNSIEGWYLKSYERNTPHGTRWNHVLVDAEGTHLVIPDNKDVTKIFLGGRIVEGAKTRFTYLGKQAFKTKDGQSAKAVKALVEQDRTDTVKFEGSEGCERIAGTAPSASTAETTINAESVPF